MTQRIFTFSFFLLLIAMSGLAQTPEQVVQKQLDAYNARDLNAFMVLFSEGAQVVNFDDGKVLANGKAEVKRLYSNLFEQSPKLHSELTNRIVLGNKVFDHESITGRMGSDEKIELVVIYEVEAGKITKATVAR